MTKSEGSSTTPRHGRNVRRDVGERNRPVPTPVTTDTPEEAPGSSLRLALVFLLPIVALIAWASLHG